MADRKTSTKNGERTLDELLDQALMHTFPASDPVAVGQPTGREPPASPTDRRAPVTELPKAPRKPPRAK